MEIKDPIEPMFGIYSQSHNKSH